jgi:maleate isomerase
VASRSQGSEGQLELTGIDDLVNTRRIGVVLPSVNTVIEPLYWRHLPPAVVLHATRLFLPARLTPEDVARLNDGVEEAGHNLASCHVDVVAYLCTASGFAAEPVAEHAAMNALGNAAGAPVVTVVDALHEAMRALCVTRPLVLSPYAPELERAEIEMFLSWGLDVVAHNSFRIADAFRLAAPGPADIVELARRSWAPEADSILITCANLRSQEVIDVLEQRYGVPVVTSTQSPLWSALRSLGWQGALPGWGRLFTC